MQETREALLALDKGKPTTKEDVLRLIVANIARKQWIFMKPRMKGERKYAIILGTIGDRGGGKSGSDAVISLIEHGFMGETIYSNMSVACDVVIDDMTASFCTGGNLRTGGTVSYKSEPLEKNALLRIDEKYFNSCILIEEINVQYSNVRRFMSNTNVDFNEVAQQIRKMESCLIYNVIDEMFVDPQLRGLTDIFIKTYDAAFDESNFGKKPRGVDFMWRVFPMTGYLAGEKKKYANTKKSLPAVCFHFGIWRDSYNDMRHQEKGIYSLSTKDKMNMMLSVESSEEMTEMQQKWEELTYTVINLSRSNQKRISMYELFEMANVSVEDEKEAIQVLKSQGVYISNSGGRKTFTIPSVDRLPCAREALA